MSKIYLASSWRNPYQPQVLEALRDRGHEVYDFRHPNEHDNGFAWSSISPEWQNWDGFEFRHALHSPVAQIGFKNDWDAMEWADTGVLLLPCGRSAHLEAGYFVGAGKKLHILLLGENEPELMYKMATSISIHPHELLGNLEVDEVDRHLYGEDGNGFTILGEDIRSSGADLDEFLKEYGGANLGLATTKQLIDEIAARSDSERSWSLDYRTTDRKF